MKNIDHIVEPLKIYDDITHASDREVTSKDEELPMICKILNAFVFKVGTAISWLSVVLILIVITQVLLRYLFSINLVQLEELQWHLYATIIMFGLSYAMVNHSHVRVDILRVNFNPRLQRKIEIFGVLVLMIPFILIVINYGIDLTNEALRINERSSSPTGLPYRWIIKSVMPISFSLLLIASISRIIRHITYLLKGSKNGN
jgi:TRAP-type mannitol/chloroaromatic compound transport system permease small subunit